METAGEEERPRSREKGGGSDIWERGKIGDGVCLKGCFVGGLGRRARDDGEGGGA